MNSKSLITVLLTTILFGIFIAAGFAKLLNTEQMVSEFQRFGYSSSFRLLIGLGEVVAAGLLLVPRAAATSAWFLVCIMLGAVWTFLTLHEFTAALMPFGIGFLCLVLAFMRRPATFNQSHVITIRELDYLWEQERQFESIRGGR
jgi:uncharacterized membrane protein YphA (DoxX/SURF4 family)